MATQEKKAWREPMRRQRKLVLNITPVSIVRAEVKADFLRYERPDQVSTLRKQQ